MLLFLSFPKFGTPSLAWIAVAPLLVAIQGTTGRRAFVVGLVAGLTANLGIYYWTAIVVSQFGGVPLPISIPLAILLCLVIALFPALFAWTMSRLGARWGTRAILLAPLIWVGLEVVRSHTMFRFAWCLLGYSQATNLPFLQVARFGGVYAVSFLLVAGSAVLGYALLERGGGWSRRAFLALVLVLSTVYWDGRRQLATPAAASGVVRLGLIQANIAQDEKWDPGLAEANMRKHVDLTRVAVAGGARFIIWPESAVPGFYDESAQLHRELGGLARGSSVSLLFGNDDRTPSPEGDRYYVGAKMLGPDGILRFRYHKINLVPFGEFVPFHSLLTLGGRFTARLTQAVSDFTPGTDRALGEVEGRRFAAFICYEAIYPDLVSDFAAGGAELLVNVTNDAWYGFTSAPYQHFEMATVRAVETGKYLVRAANTGISAVVDPRGRIVARTALFQPASLVHDVPFVKENTPYTRTGDVFAWTCLGAAVTLLLLARGKRRVQ